MPLGSGGAGSGWVEVDVVQRLAGAVQEVLPTQFLALSGGTGVAVANGAVELDRFGPGVRLVVADPSQAGVAGVRASYCEYPVTISD